MHQLATSRVKNERGSVLAIAALAMVMMLGFTALVVDLGNGRQKRRQVQSTADAAALAGAQDFLTFPAPPTTASWNKVATTVRSFAATNAGVPTADWSGCADPDRGSYTVIPSTVAVGTCVSVNSVSAPTQLRVRVPTRSLQTSFAKVLGVSALSIRGAAVAEIGSSTGPGPLPCALGGSGIVIDINGNPKLLVTSDSDAGIYANSNTYVQGAAELEGPSIVVAGSVTGGGTYDPAPVSGPVIPDPLAGYFPIPSYSTSPPPPDSPTNGTIGPGTYRDITTKKNGDVLTLTPGVYVVTRKFEPGVQGTIQGTGVTIYFPVGASFAIGNQETVNLSAPTSGTYKGLVLYFNPANSSVIDIQAGATYTLGGTLYAAGATLDVYGGPAGNSLNGAVIVKNVIARGNGEITVNYQSENNPQPPKTTYTVPNLYR